MDQKLATKRKIISQAQNSFFTTEQHIQKLTQKVIGELQLGHGPLVRKIGSLCERILH
jgi:hypothetical protein